MKKLLLIAGIVIIVICVLALIYAALNHFSYKNLRDGTREHYERLHRRAVLFLEIGIALAVTGAALIIIYFKR